QSGVVNPVHWSFRHEKVSDGRYRLIAQADLDEGWQIYTQHIDTEKIGPIPTSFYFEKQPDIEFVGDVEESGVERIAGYDQFFKMDLIKYKRQVLFVQEVKVTGEPVIQGELEFMACNDEYCTPPTFVSFVYDLSKPSGVVRGPVD